MTLIYIRYLTLNGERLLNVKWEWWIWRESRFVLIYTSIVERVIIDGLGACIVVTVLHHGVQLSYRYRTFMCPCIMINFLITTPTRCTNFSNLFLGRNSTCFGQFLYPSSYTAMVYIIQVMLTACEQDQDGTVVPSWSCSQAVSKPIWHIPLLCVQWKTPNDGQRNCPKHVEFLPTNKFKKLVPLVGFIKRKKSVGTGFFDMYSKH